MLALAPGCEHGGGDAVRPYTSVFDGGDAESYRFIDPKLVANTDDSRNTFTIMCKRYDQWGKKESIETHFLFTRTDHSYRPPGAVSNYLHSLRIGDKAKFKRSAILMNAKSSLN